MKITKFGHSCLFVEEGDARILIDPGNYSTVPALEKLDAILITHIHQDHVSIDTLKKLIELNPRARIFSNEEVHIALVTEDIEVDRLGDKEMAVVQNVIIEGVGKDHALIHKSIPLVKNTGYFIANKFFYPGDALTIPNRPVEIMAFPAMAPWMTLGQSIDYALAVKPAVAFPVHDALLKVGGLYHASLEKYFTEVGTKWVVLEEGESKEF
jgi:L-ascorbate metabolism protein UlaG (beta-lactamase superfamily)